MLHDCLLQAVIYRIPRDYHYLVDPVILSKNTEDQKYKAIRTDFPVNLGSRRKWISTGVSATGDGIKRALTQTTYPWSSIAEITT
jgi:hypothetical protein